MTLRKLAAFLLTAAMISVSVPPALAAPKPTPTPPPVSIPAKVQEPPEIIGNVLELAHSEWESLHGKRLKKCNKFTEWRGKGVSFGWCGGFVTWCMLQAGVDMKTLANTPEAEVEGVVHVKEASVGKLLRGYQQMNRTTRVPQKGFLIIYAVRKSSNKTTHVGLVYDVEELGGGKYRITTIEGNMSNTVRMYVHDYDMNAADWTHNLTTVPKDERTMDESKNFTYKLQVDSWYVNCFLMPWIPDGIAVSPAE